MIRYGLIAGIAAFVLAGPCGAVTPHAHAAAQKPAPVVKRPVQPPHAAASKPAKPAPLVLPAKPPQPGAAGPASNGRYPLRATGKRR